MKKKDNRGGPGRGQGRKPVKAGEPTVTVSLRMTYTQRQKLERLGGAKWVRERIEHAKESGNPAAQQPEEKQDGQ